jgi:hypothetical protein
VAVPICAAIVTQFVTHIWRDLGLPAESIWEVLAASDPRSGLLLARVDLFRVSDLRHA